MRRLYYFKVVAEELHFHRAAALLHLSQPALTRHISELEGDLGLRLFDRSRRNVQLTQAGSEFLQGVRRIFDQFDDSLTRARDADTGRAGTITIGAVGMVMVRQLPRVLQFYRAKYPEVAVDVRLFRSGAALEAVQRRQVELAILTGSINDPTLATMPLWKFTSCVVLPRDHRLANATSVRLSELNGETLFLQARDSVGHHSVLSLCQEQQFIPGAVREVPPMTDMETLIGLVGCGMGITILASPFREIRYPMVVIKPIPAQHTIHISACWPRDDTSPLVAQFLDVATQLIT